MILFIPSEKWTAVCCDRPMVRTAVAYTHTGTQLTTSQ